ncbi:pimeloyl-ACP methyl ester carboxylesterase [Novosphingobium sp. 1529]|uniref:alpha/beta fold hydrolase n=1 Tax=Novosphingobium sp. 1529 TaxID=3156424 RepID=UPI0033925E83
MRRFSVPLPDRGGAIAGIAFGDADRPIDALFLHANGYNALTYRALLAPLGRDCHVVAIDQRGHGKTTLPASPHGRRDYADLVLDLVALCQALGITRTVLAGHSMGGTVCLLAAQALEPVTGGLLLLDPPMLLPTEQALCTAALDGDPASNPLYAAAANRRATFRNRAEALAHYRGRGSFATWPDEPLVDYVTDGFIERQGAVALACPPPWEACNFLAHDNAVWNALAALRRPAYILVPQQGGVCRVGHDRAPASSLLVSLEHLAGTSHFLPMERPDLVRTRLRAIIAETMVN